MKGYVKCRFGHCKHDSKELKKEEAVRDGNAYYHPDCFKTKVELAQIKEYWANNINKNVNFAALTKTLNNIVFNRGVDSGLILFGLKYYVAHKINLRYPAGLYYVIENVDVQKGYARANVKKQMATFVVEEEDTSPSFIYKPTKKKGIGDLFED